MIGIGVERPARDIDLGGVILRPRSRAVTGPSGSAHIEPLVMRFLCALAGETGRMVDRTALFDTCWPGLAVGDDSLNRFAAGARRALRIAGGDGVTIETVAGAGYLLALHTPAHLGVEARGRIVHDAIAAGFASWRAGLPVPDWLAIERLRAAAAAVPDHAGCLGMLALLLRHAAEYAQLADQPVLVSECECAARAALAIDPEHPDASIALTSIVPIFGNWTTAHDRLAEVLRRHPSHVVAAHDLAIVEMATGRVRAAKSLIDRLIAADPLAPVLGYKSTYQNWTVGALSPMDKRADATLQLWPDHPAVWIARFWTLAFTGRGEAAGHMLGNTRVRPPLPDAMAAYLRLVLEAAGGATGAREAVVARSLAGAAEGPGPAVNAMMALGLLGEVDAAFAIAEGFYTQSGAAAVPIHGNPDFRVNEMRRRLTQVLFTPACAALRSDTRFAALCERIGLAAYWHETGRKPDFLPRTNG